MAGWFQSWYHSFGFCTVLSAVKMLNPKNSNGHRYLPCNHNGSGEPFPSSTTDTVSTSASNEVVSFFSSQINLLTETVKSFCFFFFLLFSCGKIFFHHILQFFLQVKKTDNFKGDVFILGAKKAPNIMKQNKNFGNFMKLSLSFWRQ